MLDLTLGEMLWSRRTVFMALVAGGPVVIALVLRALVDVDWVSVSGSTAGRPLTLTGPGMFGLMVWVFYLRCTVPVLGVFYGTSLIADEVEDKTITYLFTRPVSRGSVLFGKYLAYLICTNLVVLPSVMIVYFLLVPLLGGRIGESFPALLLDLGLLGLGLAVYGALWTAGRPDELRYVPAEVTVVAYADVREVMRSDFRQRLRGVVSSVLPNPDGQREFFDQTGIDIEDDIDRSSRVSCQGPMTPVV